MLFVTNPFQSKRIPRLATIPVDVWLLSCIIKTDKSALKTSSNRRIIRLYDSLQTSLPTRLVCRCRSISRSSFTDIKARRNFFLSGAVDCEDTRSFKFRWTAPRFSAARLNESSYCATVQRKTIFLLELKTSKHNPQRHSKVIQYTLTILVVSMNLFIWSVKSRHVFSNFVKLLIRGGFLRRHASIVF